MIYIQGQILVENNNKEVIWFGSGQNIISLIIKESVCFVFVDAYFLYMYYNAGLLHQTDLKQKLLRLERSVALATPSCV